MTTSEMLKRHVEEHNAQVKAAQDRLTAKRALRSELQAAFEQHERDTKMFYRQILARVDAIVASGERDVADLGHAIDTLEAPAAGGIASILDMTGSLRSAAHRVSHGESTDKGTGQNGPVELDHYCGLAGRP